MSFSSDWFVRLAKNNFDTYVSPLYKDKPTQYLEIGTFEGQSLLYMFKNVLTSSDSRATVIDPFDFSNNQLSTFNTNINPYLDKIVIMQGLSQNELKKLSPNTFDVIYVDGDHSSEASFTDATLSFPLLKSGGLMIFDDYLWIAGCEHILENKYNPQLMNPCNPYSGIMKFLELYSGCVEIVASNWQLLVRKL